MQDIDIKKEKALMVGVIHGNVDEATTYEHLEELELLATFSSKQVLLLLPIVV